MKKSFILFLAAFLIPNFFIGQEVTFTHAPSLLPSGTKSDHAVGVSDMNGDGKDDIVRMLVTADSPDGVEQTVYVTIQGEPGQTMTDNVMGIINASGDSSADTWGLSIVDVDRNGRNDLIAGGFYNGIYIFKSNLDNSSYTADIEILEDIFSQGMSAFDINNDGFIDVFICDDNEISQILTNDGNGNLSDVPSGLIAETDSPSDNSGNYGSCFMDVNNDGHSDLYIAKCRQGVSSPNNPRRINLLFMNDGDGNWVSEGDARGLAIGAQSWSADFGDYDNDGDLDCFVTNHDAFCDLLENDGTGYFTEVTEAAELEGVFQLTPIQSTWVELNNDGFIDLLVTGQGADYIAINDGDGTFTIYDDNFGEFPVNSYALGDLNNDGAMDIFHSAGGYGGWGSEDWEDRVYFNDGNDNNWLKVNLVGVESNLNGVGARISIYGPWGVQIREVKAGESYGIQNTMTQLFGLGTHEIVNQLTVTWPSGIIDNYYNITPDQQLTLIEGNGVSGLNDIVSEQTQVSIFPNPASETINVQIETFDDLQRRKLQFRVYDHLGKVVMVERIVSENESFNITDFATGFYSFSITADGKLIAVDDFVKH